jgi:hypothetical protein
MGPPTSHFLVFFFFQRWRERERKRKQQRRGRRNWKEINPLTPSGENCSDLAGIFSM